MCPSHQADFIRVNVICGIWLDSDIIILNLLDSLYNGIFGSNPNTHLMIELKKQIKKILGKI